jgi:hypothetical protein
MLQNHSYIASVECVIAVDHFSDIYDEVKKKIWLKILFDLILTMLTDLNKLIKTIIFLLTL